MYNTTVTLKKGEGRTLKAGGMWVFDNEIASILGTFENGDIVNIHDFDGYFMGYGYINTNSKITLRLLARRKDPVILKMATWSLWKILTAIFLVMGSST